MVLVHMIILRISTLILRLVLWWRSKPIKIVERQREAQGGIEINEAVFYFNSFNRSS